MSASVFDLPPEFCDGWLEPVPDPELVARSRVASNADWATAAFMLAAGRPVKEVAERLGCSRTTVWRTLQRSRALRRRVQEERYCLAQEASARLQGLRHAVVFCLEMALARGDARVAMWLADRLKLGAEDLLNDAALPEGEFAVGAPLELEEEPAGPDPAPPSGPAPTPPPPPQQAGEASGKAAESRADDPAPAPAAADPTPPGDPEPPVRPAMQHRTDHVAQGCAGREAAAPTPDPAAARPWYDPEIQWYGIPMPPEVAAQFPELLGRPGYSVAADDPALTVAPDQPISCAFPKSSSQP